MNQVARAFRWTGAQNNAELIVLVAAVSMAVIGTGTGFWVGRSSGWDAAMRTKPEEIRAAYADERRGSVVIVIEGIHFWIRATGKPSEYNVSTDGEHFYRVGPNARVD